MSNSSVEVIAGSCRFNKEQNTWMFILETFRETFGNLAIACFEAVELKQKGHCVIVRPRYNETEDVEIDGVVVAKPFFREWRSFDAQPFTEVRFDR